MESRPCVNSVMTVGWVHLLYNSSWKCNNLAAEQLLSGIDGAVHVQGIQLICLLIIFSLLYIYLYNAKK
jgi:hypothetical protein